MTAQLASLAYAPSRRVDPRRCDFDRLTEVDLALGGRVRDGLVAENLPSFLPDPAPELIAAARTCSGITVAERATRARRLAEIRIAWPTTGEATP